MSRIVGRREFWGLDLVLGAATLDPRPETEMLVSLGIAFAEHRPDPHILDLGTGSGAIAIALATALPAARVVATDLSPDALAAAKGNAERHGVRDRIEFRQGAWWKAVPHRQLFDLIVSNPPYIAAEEIGSLQAEVRLFDPVLALDGGPDGLDAYRAIATQAARRLRPGGLMLLEIGASQALAVSDILERVGFGRVETQKDLAGLDRVVAASHS